MYGVQCCMPSKKGVHMGMQMGPMQMTGMAAAGTNVCNELKRVQVKRTFPHAAFKHVVAAQQQLARSR